MTGKSSRRDFLKTSTLGLGAMGVADGALASAAVREVAPPTSDVQMWVTFDVHRFESYPSIRWQQIADKPAIDSIRIDPSRTYQDIWGFGASFTDGACYSLN